jgi:hypothetical protein
VSLRRYILGGYPCGDTSDTSDFTLGMLLFLGVPTAIHSLWVSLRRYIGYIGYYHGVYYYCGYPCGDTYLVGIPAGIHRIHRILAWGNSTGCGYPYGDTCLVGIPAEIRRIHRILAWGNATSCGYPYGDTCLVGIPAEILRICRTLIWTSTHLRSVSRRV